MLIKSDGDGGWKSLLGESEALLFHSLTIGKVAIYCQIFSTGQEY
jgi:hypothetical protein